MKPFLVACIFVLVLSLPITAVAMAKIQYLYKDKLVSKGETFTLKDSTLRILDENAILVVGGTLHLDNVTVTSWNNTAQKPIEYPNPRGYIFIKEPESSTSITNSELAYLGYSKNRSAQQNGLVYYDTADPHQTHVIRGNNITGMFDGLFANNFSDIVMEDNIVSNNGRNGIDPHTGSTNMIFKNNTVFHNTALGIICSIDCNNITIAENTVYDNGKGQIMLHDTDNSLVIGNTVSQSNVSGISVMEAHHNVVKGNQATGTATGIDLKGGSTDNLVTENKVLNYENSGIRVLDNTTGNEITNNVIILPTGREGHPIEVNAAVRTNNTVTDNLIVNPEQGMVED
jgi:parallel beta-helix repeat protein